MSRASADDGDRSQDRATDDDRFEELLAECIDAWPLDGGAAVFQAEPALAPRLRERLEALHQLGLLSEQAPPRAIGPYRILTLLGQGGMSVVYLAWDAEHQRHVALKASNVPLGVDDRLRARFRQEIAAVTALDHPAIVPLFGVGESEGRPYFTMEYVPGATLAQIVDMVRELALSPMEVDGATVAVVIRETAEQVLDGGVESTPEGSLPPTWIEAVTRWTLEVAEALAHAHSRRIVHRDVKPSNIMVSLSGRARLFDLGLARLADAPGLTQSGDFTGTPYYVSPEQLSGNPNDVDQRTDVFSLGVTLYELLTFRRPFDGLSTAQVFRQVLDRDPVPLRRHVPGLPADLETICLAALEKDPTVRYQSAEELAADLRRFLEFRPVRARPVGLARRGIRYMRRSPARATAILLGLLVVLGLPTGLLWANRAIADERDLAEASANDAAFQAELSARVTDYLVELFHLTPLESERAETVTAREILDRGAASIPTGFEDQPLHRAVLMRASGRIYRNMGQYGQALPLLDRAYAIYQRERGVDDLETLTLLTELADVHRQVGDVRASQALCLRSLEGFERAGLSHHDDAARCRMTLAAVSADLGQHALARETLQTALDHRLDLDDGDSLILAELTEQLGALWVLVGDHERARDQLERSLSLRRAAWVPDSLAIARLLEQLVPVYTGLHDLTRAGALATEAEALHLSLSRQRSLLTRVQGTEAARSTVSGLSGQFVQGPFVLRSAGHEAFEDSFQVGITALQSGDHELAVQAFERCLVLEPRDAVCAYNLACSHALAGQREPALRWIDQAIAFGFGFLVDGADVLKKDPDLELLRGHPSWQASLQRMEAGRAVAERYASEPGLYVPAGLHGQDRWPLLVVLHESGATKDSVLHGPWRRVADSLGLVLLAPSAQLPENEQVEDGMLWFRDAEEFLAKPWAYESSVIESIRSFCNENPVDRTKVFIAGEGMGALMAADLALTAPGLFLGLLVVNGPIVPEVAWQRTLLSSTVDLGLRVVLDDRRPIAGLPADQDASQLAAQLKTWLPRWGLDAHSAVQVVGQEDASAVEGSWIEALAELDALIVARGS